MTDTGNNRVQKFFSGGTYVTQWGIEGTGDSQFKNPSGITTDGADFVFVADTGNSRVQKFDFNGVYQAQWGGSGGSN